MHPGQDELRGTARHRALLLSLAGQLLQKMGCPHREYTVRVEVGGRREAICFTWLSGEALPGSPVDAGGEEVSVNSDQGRPEWVPPGMLWASPAEQQVLEALEAGNWMSGEQIASAIGMASDAGLKHLLANLVARCGLESQAGKGYRLAQEE